MLPAGNQLFSFPTPFFVAASNRAPHGAGVHHQFTPTERFRLLSVSDNIMDPTEKLSNFLYLLLVPVCFVSKSCDLLHEEDVGNISES